MGRRIIPPDAVDDYASTTENTTVTVQVLANDSDPDGDALTIQAVGAPAHGDAVINGEEVVYTPENGYTDDDSFTYTISDEKGGTDTATVTVTVAAGQNWPTAYRIFLPGKDSLDLLRRYRDEVLRSSDSGRRFVAELYRHSDEALAVLLTNRQLLLEARSLVNQHGDVVNQVLAGREGVIGNTVAVASFLEALAEKASPELGAVLIETRNAMLQAKKERKPFLRFRLN